MPMNKMRKKLGFSVVECVESGEGFIKGHYYAVAGHNNGIQICRVNDAGDCEAKPYANGGCGAGEINNFDDSGKPSFNPVWFCVDPKAANVPDDVFWMR